MGCFEGKCFIRPQNDIDALKDKALQNRGRGRSRFGGTKTVGVIVRRSMTGVTVVDPTEDDRDLRSRTLLGERVPRGSLIGAPGAARSCAGGDLVEGVRPPMDEDPMPAPPVPDLPVEPIRYRKPIPTPIQDVYIYPVDIPVETPPEPPSRMSSYCQDELAKSPYNGSLEALLQHELCQGEAREEMIRRGMPVPPPVPPPPPGSLAPAGTQHGSVEAVWTPIETVFSKVPMSVDVALESDAGDDSLTGGTTETPIESEKVINRLSKVGNDLNKTTVASATGLRVGSRGAPVGVIGFHRHDHDFSGPQGQTLVGVQNYDPRSALPEVRLASRRAPTNNYVSPENYYVPVAQPRTVVTQPAGRAMNLVTVPTGKKTKGAGRAIGLLTSPAGALQNWPRLQSLCKTAFKALPPSVQASYLSDHGAFTIDELVATDTSTTRNLCMSIIQTARQMGVTLPSGDIINSQPPQTAVLVAGGSRDRCPAPANYYTVGPVVGGSLGQPGCYANSVQDAITAGNALNSFGTTGWVQQPQTPTGQTPPPQLQGTSTGGWNASSTNALIQGLGQIGSGAFAFLGAQQAQETQRQMAQMEADLLRRQMEINATTNPQQQQNLLAQQNQQSAMLAAMMSAIQNQNPSALYAAQQQQQQAEAQKTILYAALGIGAVALVAGAFLLSKPRPTVTVRS